MPVKPTKGGGVPVSAAIASRTIDAIAESPVVSAASVHSLSEISMCGLGLLRDEVVDQRAERREDLLRVVLARDDPAIDLHLAAIGDDVRGAAAGDERHVDRRGADERMDPVRAGPPAGAAGTATS